MSLSKLMMLHTSAQVIIHLLNCNAIDPLSQTCVCGAPDGMEECVSQGGCMWRLCVWGGSVVSVWRREKLHSVQLVFRSFQASHTHTPTHTHMWVTQHMCHRCSAPVCSHGSLDTCESSTPSRPQVTPLPSSSPGSPPHTLSCWWR